MDWWTKLEGEEHESCISGPSRDQVAGVLLERRALHQRHCPRVDARVRRSRRQTCRGVERIRASQSAAAFFPLAASYRFAGSKWGSARPEERKGRCRGKNGGREL